MEKNMKVWIVVATWVWTSMVGSHGLSYRKVNFTTAGATKDSYTQFMQALRGELASEDKRYGIPVLRPSTTVPDSQRFLLVELSNWAEEPITLAVDVTDMYVVAYQAVNRSYFFPDAPAAVSNLFTDTQRNNLPFNSSYPALKKAGADRENTALGIEELAQAISSLHRTGNVIGKSIACSLLVSIQMVSEAGRFKYIEHRVRQSIKSNTSYESFLADNGICSLENNWGALSTAIQESNQGVFAKPVQLQSANYSQYNVYSMDSRPAANPAIMKFVCRETASDQFSPISFVLANEDTCPDPNPTVYSSGRNDLCVDTRDGRYNDGNPIQYLWTCDEQLDTCADQFSRLRYDVVDDDTCVYPEPTVRITGRNGLCVDVRDAEYRDGNPIQLWTCKQQLDVNQLWTLKTDGTIRSNGKCLTTNGSSPGNNVTIYNCNSAKNADTRWKLLKGTFANPHSGLVLSAKSGDSGTTLTMETNHYAPWQGWLAGNNSEPFVTSIVGFMDLCMQANGGAVWLVECAGSNKAEQQWPIYADGSIRPQQNPDRCLTSNYHSKGSTISILNCSHGWSSQRWVFGNDGTILNLSNGMVMDVKESNPSLRQIIIWPFTGNPNQKWFTLL